MKTIVYLDQPVISNVAKGLTPDQAAARVDPLYVQLHAKLCRLVESDVIICPESSFHEEEAELDRRVADRARQVVKHLSWGVKMLHWTIVLRDQVNRGLRRHLGYAVEDELSTWKHAYHKDPNEPLSKTLIDVHIPLPRWVYEETRQLKARYEALSAPPRMSDLESQIAWAKRSCADGYARIPLVRAAIRMIEGDIWNVGAASSIASTLHLYSRLTGSTAALPGREFWSFFESPDFDGLPFVDVYATIFGGREFLDPRRRPRGSDLDDALIAASAVPCCDAFVTDSYLARLLIRLGLNVKYSCQVFSVKSAGIRQFSEWLDALSAAPPPAVSPAGSP